MGHICNKKKKTLIETFYSSKPRGTLNIPFLISRSDEVEA